MAIFTGCQRRRNGSSLQGREVRRLIRKNPTRWAGIKRTTVSKHTGSVRRSRMPGACTTLAGTFGNGREIGMPKVITKILRKAIQRAHHRGGSIPYVAVPGLNPWRMLAFPNGTTSKTPRISTSASELYGSLRKSCTKRLTGPWEKGDQ